ncbi:MAG: AarF/ABC1/UbiB kinase family protein [Candidatus Binatus sp.]|uniref:ABC1 kinase family protein n=1 Tax=Candidatus Binatus sp. TaxID=2811406 RepID=UPI002727E431|nr:AarF/ABC1/UbiB kinase family protein [Candidatus Binatus sp.]MDO8435008.1 AarF/ABC1/UbiB kinase family protein [Candidatus Binatus sp.]
MPKRTSLTSGRARRAMKMGELASQVGSSYLWNQLRRPFLSAPARERELLETHIRNARRVVEGSQQLRGAFMKLIQMLSMRQDLLPGEALDVLRATQSNVPPMSYSTISEQILREIGKRPEALFRSFDQTAFAAASLGQVHRAITRDGIEVAVKVQYPGVEDTVEQDLGNLKLLLRTLQALGHDVMRQEIDTGAIYKELEQRLREELDYVNEARNMTEFKRRLEDDDEIVIPRCLKELSSRRVLTMTYVDGYPLADVMGDGVDLELREWVAHKMHAFAWRQILEFGVLHTDFHPGNYVVSHHPRMGVLDFGSIRRFPEPVRKANLQVARAIVSGDDKLLAAGMIKLGYLDREQDPAPMVEVIHILFEPMMTDRDFDPLEYDAVAKASKVGEIALGNRLYKSPAHSVFLIRALIGLEGITRGLGVKTNYRRIFKQCIDRIPK